MFDGSEKEIGRGLQATVYLYKGFAYKVFNESYPAQWVEYEVDIQNEVNKAPLNTAKYYKTDNPYIIKMDFIDGITLADRMRGQKYPHGVEDLIALQKEINKVNGLTLPRITAEYKSQLESFVKDEDIRATSLEYLADIGDGDNLCHLDFHFLNVMYAGGRYYPIDWVNAKLGNPVYDYARTYVVLYEHAYRFGQKYLSMIKKDKTADTSKLSKAIYLSSLLRQQETDSEKIKELFTKVRAELAQ